MNCQEFKKSLIAAFKKDTVSEDPQVLEHLKTCRTCHSTVSAMAVLKVSNVEGIEEAFKISQEASMIAEKSTVTVVIDLKLRKIIRAFFALHPVAFESESPAILVRSICPAKGAKEAGKIKSDIQQTLVEREGLVGKDLVVACDALIVELMKVIKMGTYISATLDLAKKVEVTL